MRNRQSAYDLLQFMFATWRFPLFTICFLTFYTVLLFVLLLVPQGDTQLSAFAEEFKTWCFGYDPATHHFEVAYLVMMISNPILIIALVTGIWWGPLKAIRFQIKRIVKTALTAAGVAAGAVAALFLTAQTPTSNQTELPFPAEALRIHHQPPDFTLTNQAHEPVSLAQFHGKVVLVTAVYASCGYTCPMIMQQTKRAIGQLTDRERDQVIVLAITLDPKRDRPEVLAGMAQGQQVGLPAYQFLTGDPATVNRVLDRFDFARWRNPETGVLDHNNLFLLIDRQGKLSFRFTLGDRQEQWLVKALRVLIHERDANS